MLLRKGFAVLVLLLFSGFSPENQVEQGIVFESISFEEAKEKARKEGKLIFIEVFTTWCGNCKRLDSQTLNSSKVGRHFNEKYINLRIDAENSQDGKDLTRMYQITAYPTLLFVDSNGKLKRKYLGFRSEDQMISLAEMNKI